MDGKRAQIIENLCVSAFEIKSVMNTRTSQ